AIELWETKGATVLVERARRGMGRARQVARTSDGNSGAVFRDRPHVLPNAAIADATRFVAALTAADPDAIAAHLTGGVVDHNTGAAYDRETLLPSYLGLRNATDGRYVVEPLATLGDSLALCRQWASASKVADSTFDVGPFEHEHIMLIEVDGEGRRARTG